AHPLTMVDSTSCLHIAMLLMSMDIMFARSHHATDERRHTTFRAWSSPVHGRFSIMSDVVPETVVVPFRFASSFYIYHIYSHVITSSYISIPPFLATRLSANLLLQFPTRPWNSLTCTGRYR